MRYVFLLTFFPISSPKPVDKHRDRKQKVVQATQSRARDLRLKPIKRRQGLSDKDLTATLRGYEDWDVNAHDWLADLDLEFLKLVDPIAYNAYLKWLEMDSFLKMT